MIGQAAAKQPAVAIALRNRIRRQKLEPEMAEDVMPKNILMMGPTGVGKTEIARRLGQARELAVPESGGEQVHRGRLRGPRRGVDDSRSASKSPSTWCAKSGWMKSRSAPNVRPKNDLLDLLMPAQPEGVRAAGKDARQAAGAAARGQTRRPRGGTGCAGSRADVRDLHAGRH